ncbi:uncharacterized protein SPPG_00077 [Spizellomyces punctatus DAOM BR117]|uniref:DNA-dependent protein kinase catalytic subunit n=1 Tax=Spizellomyces punctatus (strain DAOM BR117) TaxID=645134 RepID=A0A0L0HSK6_SPIPD|nr:uncharacterized protein SPPG_00077 [Spizellomyces punctatus DAOM BR117]KND04346.1 hypothetical protein SPPG_00077 [Spizellomyces punctatus DAOM BR117]|eukprot:XP_016612385.1 hypothetical protein SPPG_00077 [Spizellomyces punctatus DAOM BR117]
MYETSSSLRQYAIDIQSICQSLFSSFKESSKVKAESFNVLSALLDPTLNIIDPKKIDIQKLFQFYLQTYVQQQTKLTSSVKGALLRLLGNISRYFPSVIDASQISHLHHIVIQCVSTLFEKNPDLPHIEGAIRALDDLMFRADLDRDLGIIGGYVRRMIEPLGELTQYSIPKAALQIVIDHAAKLQGPFYENYAAIYVDLRNASQHQNIDVSRLGYRAIDQFLKIIAMVLKNKSSEQDAKKCFWWFMRQFTDILQQNKAAYKDVSLAIRGYGFFAGPCKQLLDPGQLNLMLEHLVAKNAFLNSEGTGNREDILSHIPSFLEAYAFIADELDVIDTELLAAVEAIAKTMLSKFSSMGAAYRGLSVSAFRNLLGVLNKKGPIGTALWSKIAYETIVITCTSTSSDDIVNDGQPAAARFAFDDYLFFWEHLFKSTSADNERLDSDDRKKLDDMLYDETIKALIQLPQNLNLSLTEVNQPAVVEAANDTNLQAVNGVDVAILVTFSRFCEHFLTRVRTERFSNWIYIVGNKWIELSLRNPLISGFYNLFSVILRLSNSTGFFEGTLAPDRKGIHEGTEEDFAEQATSEQRRTYVLFFNYIREVLVRLQGYKDDLLASCLRVVLACPSELISVKDTVQPLRIALRLGLSFPPLANIALETLERWIADFPADVLRPAYKGVLPLLADYLVLDVESDQPSSSAPRQSLSKNGLISIQRASAAKIRAKLAALATIDETTNTQLRAIRYRIIVLLGMIGGDNRFLLEEGRGSQQLIAWDTEKRVWFDMPFKEINCRIYMDDILPRVMDLAESSPDRKTKIAATELLHACVIVMIGRSAKQLTNVGRTSAAKKSPFHNLYRKVFPGLLRLAVDLDKVTRDLFRPLVFQIIHWLTKNSKAENAETMAMLNACIDAVSGDDGPGREFAGECIAEFLAWSIKHTLPKELDQSPMNAKSLLKRMYRLLSHSSSHKRMGGAVTFNRIYRIFREEESLVDQFSFEILYHLLMALRLAENDHTGLGTQQMTIKGVQHVLKIIKSKSDLFRSSKSTRRSFPGLNEANLAGLVDWIFAEIGRLELTYAQQCMQVFMELVPLISTPNEFVRSRSSSKPTFIPDILERTNLVFPSDADLQSKTVSLWLSQLTTALSGYTFLIDAKIMEARTILEQTQSQLLPAFVRFINIYADADVDGTVNPAAKHLYNQIRSLTIAKAVDFLLSVLQRDGFENAKKLEKAKIWSSKFFHIIATCVFRPHDVGFAIESQEVKRNLPRRMESVLRSMKKNLPEMWQKVMVQSLADVYFNDQIDLAKVNPNDLQRRGMLLRTTAGLQQLCRADMFDAVMETRAMDTSANIVRLIGSLRDETDPSTIVVVGSLLQVCLMHTSSREQYFSQILCLENEKDAETSIKFYQRYASYINSELARNLDQYVDFFEKHLQHPIVHTILLGIPDYLIVNRTSKADECLAFMDQFVKHSAFLTKVVREYNFGNTLQLLKKIVQLDPNVLARTATSDFFTVFTDAYVTLLDVANPLATITDALNLLPAYLLVPSNAAKLERRLNDIVVNQFPISPKDLVEGTAQYSDYVDAMNSLMRALELSDGVVIPKVLARHVCRERDHLFAASLKKAVGIAARRLSASDMDKLTSTLLGFFFDSSLPVEVRSNVVLHMLVPALSVAPKAYVRTAFVRHINQIMTTLSGPLSSKEHEQKSQLLTRTACYELMDVCYSRLDTHDVHSTAGSIVKSYCNGTPKTGKELSVDLIKLANTSKNENFREEPGGVTSFRTTYHQTAYNVLASVIASTQRDQLVKFCTTFLFKENRQKQEDPWKNIVDIHEDLREKLNEVSLLQARAIGAFPIRQAYRPSQFLADSSLSQTITIPLDRPSTNASSGPVYSAPTQSSLQEGDTWNPDQGELMTTSPTGDQSSTSLIFDHNICMSRIVDIIKKLNAVPNTDGKTPTWMQELLKKMSETDTPLNVRVFIAAIVMNVPEAFSANAGEWWKCFAELIAVHTQFSKGVRGFVQDLCLQLLKWGGSAKGEETQQSLGLDDDHDTRTILFKMMESLVASVCVADSMPEVRENLELIASFIELWPSLMVAPTRIIYEYITNQKRENLLAGIYLILVYVTHGVPPFDMRGLGALSLSEDQFCDAFMSLLVNSRKEIYSFSAEVLGRWISFARKNGAGIAAQLEEKLRNLLRSLNGVRGSGTEQDRFVLILNRLSVGYPDIVKDYAKDLLFILPRLYGRVRAKCLYALSSSAPDIEGLFADLRAKNLQQLIQHRDDESQAHVLVILLNLAPSLRNEDVSYFLATAIETFSGHPSAKCRSAFYTLMMRLHERTDLEAKINRVLKLAILQGLTDPTEEIRGAVTSYLRQGGRMGQGDIFSRTEFLLGSLYEPEVESSYLNFSTYFLIDVAKEAPQYGTNMFDSGLPDATFADASLDTDVSWLGSGSMQPLFAATQARMQARGTQAVGFVRATQQVQWTPTLDTQIGPVQARDIFSGSESESTSAFTSTQFEGPQADRTRFTSYTRRQAQGTYDHRFYATQQERQKRARAKNEQLQKIARARTVTLARKYRIGELPDIEIQHSEIINPLQALAMRDSEVGQQVFSSLVASVLGHVDDYQGMDEERKEEYKSVIGQHLQDILNRSVNLHPPVMAAILRVLYQMPVAACSPQLIFRASEGSANNEMGILLLEKLANDAPQPPASKRSRTGRNASKKQSIEFWVQLARLYRSMNKVDVYRPLYETRVSSNHVVKEAITAESLGQYDRALRAYKQALETDEKLEEHEADICHRGLVECLNKLGLWDELAHYIMTDLNNSTEHLWDADYQDPDLRLFFRAFLRLRHGFQNDSGIRLEWKEDRPNPLYDFIAKAMEDPVKRDFLGSLFSKDLSLALVSSGDLNRALHYVRRAQDEFLQGFATLNPLAYEARLSKLSQIQVIMELRSFLQLIQDPKSRSMRFEALVKQWARYPLIDLDSIEVWDDIMLAREVIAEKCADVGFSLEQKSIVNSKLQDTRHIMARAARKHHRFYMAERYLTQSVQNGFDDIFNYNALKLSFVRMKQLQGQEMLEIAGKAMQNFAFYKTEIQKLEPLQRAKFLSLEGRLYDTIVQTVLDETDLVELFLSNKHLKKAIKGLGCDQPHDGTALLRVLTSRAYACLQQAVSDSPKDKHRLRIAIHCDRTLRRMEEERGASGDLRSFIDTCLYARMVITNTLAAMKSGKRDAIEAYPRLLQLIELYEETADDFQRMATSVPSWTFLRWMPQMTALLDKPSAQAVYPVIEKIGRDYPSALYFPLSISSEQYTFGNDAGSQRNKKRIEALKTIISSPLLEKFKFELQRLTEPVHIFKDWLERTDSLIRSVRPDKEAAIVTAFEEMAAYCLTQNSDMGEVGRAFASKHAAKLFKILGKDGSKLANMKLPEWKEVQKYYHQFIHGKEALPQGMVALKNYSPWLANFNARNYNEELEIPGQYEGLTMPRPQQHVKVISFHSEVLVMSSMRRPKRLIILGSDEKEHPWLIKGGEDLRLDQRVQQMFSIMNDIMLHDMNCLEGGLFLRTYKVIPMSTSLGILEWVENTKPLREVMMSIPGFKEEYSRADQKHAAFVESFKGHARNLGDMYGNMFRKASRNRTVDHMSSLTSFEPYLRTWMHKLAASPEAFLSIRAQFAKSLATLNICSYLLGIGDRHAENFLIDMTTGQIVGIDFGHAFGSATEVLPIPELIPFRLTRQMELALEPLGISVLLEYPMINVLTAMRSRKDVLLNALNIFIKEPLMEWRRFALSQAQKQGKTSQDASGSSENVLNPPEWYPQQKLDIARRKLEGDNPCYITTQELEWGHGEKPWFQAVRDVVMGEKGTNRRSDVGQKCSSVKEQVECLIDQATDPNILGRAWRGWGAWC